STKGESLSNPQILNLESPNPDVTWYYHNMYEGDAHDGIDGDLNTREWTEWLGAVKFADGTIDNNWTFTCIEKNVQDNRNYAPDPPVYDPSTETLQTYDYNCTGAEDMQMASNDGKDPENMIFCGGVLNELIADMGNATPQSPSLSIWTETETRYDDDWGALSGIVGSLFGDNLGDQLFTSHKAVDADYRASSLHVYDQLSEDEWIQAHPSYPQAKKADWWGASGNYISRYWGQWGTWGRPDIIVTIN
ncbi:MAG: hypothetical protein ACREBW_00350, partial [Candidatus Micrarchaeaceae archaeon]